MTPVFTINFQREALTRRQHRERSRVVGLALWLSYFGALAAVLGLYGLNCQTITQRAVQIERESYHLGTLELHGDVTGVPPAEVDEVEKFASNPWRWHERLAHLARTLPADARITSLAVNPDGVSGTPDQNKLVIQGQIRGRSDVQSVMGVLASLQRDSVFAADYSSIRLVSTHAAAETGQSAEFVIECR